MNGVINEDPFPRDAKGNLIFSEWWRIEKERQRTQIEKGNSILSKGMNQPNKIFQDWLEFGRLNTRKADEIIAREKQKKEYEEWIIELDRNIKRNIESIKRERDEIKSKKSKELKNTIKQMTIEDEIILADNRAKKLAIIHRDAKEKLKKEYDAYLKENSMTQRENMFTIGEIMINQ
jgi:hypothetical protein